MNKMKYESEIVDKNQVLLLCLKSLRLFDERIIEHGERVAYIAKCLLENIEGKAKIQWKELCILCLFHDIGAYKTEEINRMLEFESSDVWHHSVYGYLFLKHFTPIGDLSEAVLYHHTHCEDYDKIECLYKEYAGLIHIADRLDIAISLGKDKHEFETTLCPLRFMPQHLEATKKVLNETSLYEDIASGGFRDKLLIYLQRLDMSSSEAFLYLRMLVFTIDFKSEQTVVHSFNITEISIYLGKILDMGAVEIEKIYFASLIHDLGKMAMPAEILEFPGKLTVEQREIMKEHVVYTEKIIRDVVSDEICKMAVRHHERLDGTGYPRKLLGDQLSLGDRIVAVADILSALMSKRSYKDQYDKEKTLRILNTMVEQGGLDALVVAKINEHFDEILQIVQVKTDPIIQVYGRICTEYKEVMKKLEENHLA